MLLRAKLQINSENAKSIPCLVLVVEPAHTPINITCAKRRLLLLVLVKLNLLFEECDPIFKELDALVLDILRSFVMPPL